MRQSDEAARESTKAERCKQANNRPKIEPQRSSAEVEGQGGRGARRGK